jgi:iron complex transport system substrate-binding protein
MTITDQLGRQVTLTTPTPQRIVSLAPSNTEILFALGLEDRLFGVTDYCDYPPEAEEKKSVGGFSTANIEEIVATNADLILATSKHKDKVVPQLEAKGLTVVVIAPETFDEVLEGIQLIGLVTGEEEKAAALLNDMRGRINTITETIAGLPEEERVPVFYLTWHDPLKTSGGDTLINELIITAGGKNIFAEVSGADTVDLEVLISRNPEVMIAGTGMGSGEEETLRFLKTESRLKDIEASINGRIYGINMDLTGRPGPRIVDGLEQFARCIHPEIFGQPDDN